MKKLKLILIVAILVFTISIAVIYFEGKKKNRQKETKKSLQEGFGSYSNEESLGCFSSDGKCTTEGVETTVQYCRPHPYTKRGCIDQDGNQTYATVIKKRPCQTQCASSKFTVEEGLRLSDPSISYLGTDMSHGIESLGCDNIIDKKFGLDFTNYFLGTFDKEQSKYPLKTCIPHGKDSLFRGYYQKVSTCLSSDGKGSNNCTVMCGRDKNILNLNGFANAKLNKKLINYFPTEISEDGEVRNVCYDINNIDQIELLNYPGKVPEDFVYPNKCYKHTNVLNFTSDIWPNSGVSNIFSLSLVQVTANVSYIDLKGPQIEQFNKYVLGNIISSDYDLNKNQNSYVKLRVGSDLALLEKVLPETNSGIHAHSTIESNTFYICCNLKSTANFDTFKNYLYTVPKTTDFFNAGANNVFTNPSYFNDVSQAFTKKYIIEDRTNLNISFPCSFLDFFKELPGISTVSILNNTTYINNSGITTAMSYFYMIIKNQIDGSLQHVFLKASAVVAKNATFDGKTVFDDYHKTLEKLYVFNSVIPMNTSGKSTSISFKPGGFIITLDFTKSFLTDTVFSKTIGTSTASYNFLEIKKDISTLVEELNGKNPPFCVFSTSPNNNTVGYNYPLYLNQTPEFRQKINFSEFPGLDFYTLEGPSVKEITSNYYYRPFHYKNEGMSLFNEEILEASVTYSNNYMKFHNKKNYFFSELNTINSGSGYKPGNLYNFYNKNFDKRYNLKTTGLTHGQGLSPTMGVIMNKAQPTTIKPIKIIRGNSPIVSAGVGTTLEFTPNQKKVKSYFKMIKYQNFESDADELLIFDPEKHLSLQADYSVFKSPYTINEDESPNFLCYDESGRARPEGYSVQISTNGSKVYTNLACPNKTVDYEVIGDHGALCGVKGIEDTNINQKNKLDYCTQERDEKAINYFNSNTECIISTDTSDYKTINNQLGFGFKLRPIKKGISIGGTINNNVPTYPSYFTKLQEVNKLYGPGEEFFVQKSENNYYVSLSNNNLSFVDNVEKWRRIYPFQNNTEISPYQYFFNVHPSIIENNTINLELGKFGNKTYNLKINKGTDINIAFNTNTSGITSQNYLNQGVTYFWGGQRKEIVSNPQLKAGQPARSAATDLNNALLQETGVHFDNVGSNGGWHTAVDCVPKSLVSNATLLPLAGPMCYNGMGGYVIAGGQLYGVRIKEEAGIKAYTAPTLYKRLTFDPSEHLEKGVPYQFNIETFIGRILLATQRIDYDQLSPSMGSKGYPDTKNPGCGPYPGYASLKFQPILGTEPSTLYPESPIVATFDIVKKDKYKFSSKFYDSNLDIPWESSNMQPGDYFNPDFIYFNTFIYSYILSKFNPGNDDRDKYGYPGNNIVSDLNPIFLTSTSSTEVNAFKLSDIKSSSGFTIKISPGYNNPKISDFILVIPENLFTTDSKGNYVLDNGPVVYPTMQIRRIQEINNASDNLKTVKFEDRTYSNAKEFNSETNVDSVYLVNLGKQTGKDNLITRTFKIVDVSEIAFDVVTKITGQPNIDKTMAYIATKKFIEFEFEIDSISQSIMKKLYTNNNQRKIADKPPKENKYEGATANGTSPCAGNKLYYNTDVDKDIPDWACFTAGCMPGNAPANAMCYSGLNSVGGTDLGCPAGKYWNCPDNSTTTAAQKAENVNSYQRFGGNFLTPALSARYIKSSFQSPYEKITSSYTFPTLNNSSREDILKTKVMAQCTEIAKYGDYYYFNEFRENRDIITPTQPLTFKVGDTFKYYQSVLGIKEVLTGNKNFHKFAEFKVVDIDVIHSYTFTQTTLTGQRGVPGQDHEDAAKSVYASSEPVRNSIDLDIYYDYKCAIVKGSIDTFNTSGDILNNNNIVYNNLDETLINPNSDRRSLPYTVTSTWVDGGGESVKIVHQRSRFLGYNKDHGYAFLNEKYLELAQAFVDTNFNSISSYNDTNIFWTPNPEEAQLDYYNFPTSWLPDDFTQEPSFGLKADGNFSGAGAGGWPSDYPGGIELNNLLKFVERGQQSTYTTMENIIGQNSVNRVIQRFFLDSQQPEYNNTWTIDNNKVNDTDATYGRFSQDGHFSANYANVSGNLGGVGLTLKLATVLSGGAIRTGMLDMMVLSGTEVESDIGQKAYINVTVSGKPYGVGYFPAGPESEDSMINYDAFGRIESFKFISPQNLPVNTVLKSDKGFQIKFLAKPPPVYTFENIESPSMDVSNYKNNFNYATSEIVNVKNKNLRQYFRNTSSLTIPYMRQISVVNPYIPFSILSGAIWIYPVYKYNIPGTTALNLEGNITVFVKDKYYTADTNVSTYINYSVKNKDLYEILNSFKSVAITVYPEDNFVEYDKNTYYAKGDIVKTFTGNELRLFRSLINKNIGNDVNNTLFWSVDDLTGKLSSFNPSDFYSVFKEDDNFTTYIDDVKNLNNQNLPALIKNSFNNTAEKEFCPQQCILYNLQEDYKDTFLQSDYFDNIRYLFETPVILTKDEETSLVVSLGNTPVTISKNYNTGFLQDGGATNDFLSQYLYFINIKNQQNKYDRSSCTGDFSITTPNGQQSTGADKFEFANSLLFNFLPCGLDDQDFIKYNVDIGMSIGTSFLVSSLPSYASSSTPNIFPPSGVSCRVLISSGEGKVFTPSDGYFEYSRPITYPKTIKGNYTLINNNNSGIKIDAQNISVNTKGVSINNSTGFEYGDIWYSVNDQGDQLDMPFGFIIPDRLTSGISTSSLIQLNNSTNYTTNVKVIPSNRTLNNVTTPNVINNFNLQLHNDSAPGVSGIYTDSSTTPGTSFYIQVDNNNNIMQRTSAIFRGNTNVTDAECIYLPSYDIRKNIKAQAVTVFGENFVGDLNYSLDTKNPIYSLDGKERSVMIFNEFRNNLLLTDIDKRKAEVFSGDKTVNIENLYKTFIINFGSDTFSIRPNLFESPITNPTNKFLYSKSGSVDPSLPIASINTESTTVLISEGMSTLKGTSVKLNFDDFLNYNTTYSTKNGKSTSIPGKTNAQIQLTELRQNRTDDYIQESNKCSVYFEPLVSAKATAYSAATWKVKVTSRGAYFSGSTTESSTRFSGTFSNGTKVELYNPITFFLGCNLNYTFDQSDKSNTKPMVFSTQEFTSSTQISTSTISIGNPGNRKFNIQYLLDGERVTFDTYSDKFSSSTTRAIEIMYQGDFSLTSSDYNTLPETSIYYGINEAPFSKMGGKMGFRYH